MPPDPVRQADEFGNPVEFEGWASGVAERFGYGVRFEPVGLVDAERGAPTQMAVFMQKEVAA